MQFSHISAILAMAIAAHARATPDTTTSAAAATPTGLPPEFIACIQQYASGEVGYLKGYPVDSHGKKDHDCIENCSETGFANYKSCAPSTAPLKMKSKKKRDDNAQGTDLETTKVQGELASIK
ncbi:hypothetical protein G7Y89_g14157 [Cudoniella acicularis]|uniref:Uncharacterized protein n=1 Tax=Cudoniella acicularis TaxID=354080 RepID=A0A8H4R5W7_9HELO|nr:hypothetical protein G7Y89_g14157 [Cudoniella acicularis]